MTALGRGHHTSLTRWRCAGAVAVATAALATGLAACGSGSPTKASSTSTNSSAASSPSSPAAQDTSATSLKTVTTNGAQIQVPSDWRVSQESNGPAGGAPPAPGSSVNPAVFSLQASQDPLGSTASRAQTALSHAGKSAKRLPDLHVNGVSLYHVQYKAGATFRDDFGAVVNGVFYHVGWNFTTVEGMTRAAADKYMNPVMATFKLTS